MRGIPLSQAMTASFPQLDNQALQAATDGCYILYHDKAENFPTFCPWWEWPGREAVGETADGIAILIDNGSPIILSLDEKKVLWSLNGISATELIGNSAYQKAFKDFDGESKSKTIMAKGAELFGEEEDTWKENYAVPWCLSYDKSYIADTGYKRGYGAGSWWLPSIGELVEIFKRYKAVDKCLSVVKGATLLHRERYLSSSEATATAVWSLSRRGLERYFLFGWSGKTSAPYFARPVSTIKS